MTRGLMIAAPRSGAGKTTVTLGLLRAFKRRGVDVVGLKSGPDYIDPTFHAAASGREGVNLDSWAMAPKLLAALAARAAGPSALALCDGGKIDDLAPLACLRENEQPGRLPDKPAQGVIGSS